MVMPRIPSTPVVCRNLSGGLWVEGRSSERRSIASPYNNEIISIVPETTTDEIDKIVAAAQVAALKWR